MGDAPLPSSFDDDPNFYDDNRIRKFFKRMKDEPLVPLGIGLTCWAFYNASQSIRTGNSVRTNRFFRYRLYAQGFTLVAMVGGSIYYRADRLKRTEYTKLKDQQKKQEKREKWIKELEARDAEDREWRTKLGKVQDLQREEEERRLVEQAKMRREKEKDMQSQTQGRGHDDGKSVIQAIQKEVHQGKKGSNEARQGKELLVADPVKPPLPDSIPQDQEQEQKQEQVKPKYESVLGERERGGLLGHKYISGFYEHRLKPFAEQYIGKKGEEEEGAPSKESEGEGEGKKEE